MIRPLPRETGGAEGRPANLAPPFPLLATPAWLGEKVSGNNSYNPTSSPIPSIVARRVIPALQVPRSAEARLRPAEAGLTARGRNVHPPIPVHSPTVPANLHHWARLLSSTRVKPRPPRAESSLRTPGPKGAGTEKMSVRVTNRRFSPRVTSLGARPGPLLRCW